MDPLAIQGAANTGWTRPPQLTAVELQTGLQQGRVFAGDVLQTLSGGTVLLGVGALRVPARAQTQLQLGRRYWFEVLSSGVPLELRVAAPPQAEQQPELLRALRSLLGAEAPVGALLEELARLLGESRLRSSEPNAPWERAVSEHTWRPGEDGAELRTKLEHSGLAFEGHLAEAALDDALPAESERIGSELLGAWQAQLQAALAGNDQATSMLEKLARALAQVLGAPASGGRGAPAAQLDPARHLERALAQLAPAEARALASALEVLDWARWPTWMRRLLLRTLAPGAARDDHARELSGSLLRDLKGQLLAAHEQLGDGALRNAVERALNGIEADQLLNLARAEVDESAQWSLPLHDGERWSTLHLAVVRDGSRAAAPGDARARRVALEVEFSRTGAVHVDLLQTEHGVSARVVAYDAQVVEALAQRLPELEQLLSAGGTAARVSLARASDERELHHDAPAHSSFFASRHVMDVEG